MVLYLKKYVEINQAEDRVTDLIFFTGTQARSRVSRNDHLLPRGSEFRPKSEIPASPGVQTRPRPA